MTYFKLDRFSGIAPGVSPRLLAEQFGQIAEDIDFESGALKPITGDSASVHTLQDGSKQSIYYYREASWLRVCPRLCTCSKKPEFPATV